MDLVPCFIVRAAQNGTSDFCPSVVLLCEEALVRATLFDYVNLLMYPVSSCCVQPSLLLFDRDLSERAWTRRLQMVLRTFDSGHQVLLASQSTWQSNHRNNRSS